ncbi:MAG: signal peptidase II [Candidatus Cloacimonetes bacterium]|nr:signal peptidase II [Candidatus Cloacimonadota bacterium]
MQEYPKPNLKPAIWIMAVIVVLDQLTKILIILNVPLFAESYKSIPILGDTLMLTHVRNTGAAFSMSLGSPTLNRIFFIAASIIIMGMIIYMLRYAIHRAHVWGYGFVLGGAIGNLIDRIRVGYVTDFIDMDFPNFIMERWPIYNIADSAIVIAMGILIFDLIFVKDIPANQLSDPDTLTEDQVIGNESAPNP